MSTTDPRRLGHAQRRRIGGASNVYGATTKAPSFGLTEQVQAQGRYGPVTVTGIMPNVTRPDGVNDGHAYVVKGGKSGRESMHLSGELSPFEMGMEEAV
jgi:hypothetical protein